MTFGAETGAEQAHAQLDHYTEAGGTMIETADVYSGGHSEEIVGEWLRGQSDVARNRLVIAGKGRFPVDVDPRDSGTSRRHLRRALEGTLRRLGVDHIDLYQVHSWDPITPLDETLGFLESAVQSGKISYAGLSNFLGWQIAQAASAARGRFPLLNAAAIQSAGARGRVGNLAGLRSQRARSAPVVAPRWWMASWQVLKRPAPLRCDTLR
ncbi:aldo/keto reductase [Cryobacterium serini]|uniref:aldo/keto reductase n=1 Tax=Cryobacterium serini TaxID=1259201 RepID=UPI0030B9DA95